MDQQESTLMRNRAAQKTLMCSRIVFRSFKCFICFYNCCVEYRKKIWNCKDLYVLTNKKQLQTVSYWNIKCEFQDYPLTFCVLNVMDIKLRMIILNWVTYRTCLNIGIPNKYVTFVDNSHSKGILEL